MLDTTDLLLYNGTHIDEHKAGVTQHEKGNEPMAKRTKICNVPCRFVPLSKRDLRALSVYELHEEISALYEHLADHGMLDPTND
jgi:hypothetical protein